MENPFHENMADLVDEDTARKTFQDLGINDWLINQCKAVGLTRPTPIQYHCVPEILKGQLISEKSDNFKSNCCQCWINKMVKLFTHLIVVVGAMQCDVNYIFMDPSVDKSKIVKTRNSLRFKINYLNYHLKLI
jgi:hypothetical protein